MAVYQLSKYFRSFIMLCFSMRFFIHAEDMPKPSLPVVINTWNFKEANEMAFGKLITGGSALDAVEEGCQICETMQCEGTVGFGGSPDENGETTLDAMIMDGKTMNAGAVGALRNIKNAVSVARHVLEHTDHTLLVGTQATDFALKMGFKKETLSTSTSQAAWSKWKSGSCQPNFWKNVDPNPRSVCGPYRPKYNGFDYAVNESYFSKNNHDTIGIIAIDQNKNIAVATSTNGASHKIPGRVGDSPIIGSGGYALNGVGAAAATGDGDILMRFLPSFRAIMGLQLGFVPREAAKFALMDIRHYYPHYSGAVIVVNASGKFGAACHGMSEFPFSVSQSGYPTKVYTIQC